MGSYQPAPISSGLDDLLGLGSDGLLGDIGGTTSPPTVQMQPTIPMSGSGGFGAPPAPFGAAPLAMPVAPAVIPTAAVAPAAAANPFAGLGDIFGTAAAAPSFLGAQVSYVAPKAVNFYSLVQGA